jgi:hypothetical protein
MGVKPNRIGKLLLAGAVGAFVALLLLVIAPTDAPLVESGSAALSAPRANGRSAPADARSASRDGPAETPPAADGVVTGSAPVRATEVAAPPSVVATSVEAGSAPNAAARTNGPAEPQEESPPDANDELERPAQWCFLKTRDDHDYRSDSSAVFNGSRSVWMGKDNDVEAAGGYFSSDILWQGADATAFRGLRIEVSAHVKGMGYFQFFVRTATAEDGGIVLNDNQLPSVPMTNRYVRLFPPNGAEWARLSIVADVSLETDVVYYGIGLNNGRAIWIDDVRIARVDPDTPLTREPSHGGRFILPVDSRAALAAPSNLDFEVATRGARGCSTIASPL